MRFGSNSYLFLSKMNVWVLILGLVACNLLLESTSEVFYIEIEHVDCDPEAVWLQGE